MTSAASPSNGDHRLTDYDDPNLDDQHLGLSQSSDTLGYRLDQIPQANLAAQLTSASFALDPDLLDPVGGAETDGDEDEDYSTLDYPADQLTQSHAALDSAYGGSPHHNDSIQSVSTSGRGRGGDKKAKKFVCGTGVCTKAFARRSDLLRHTRIHTNERPFGCTHFGCGKSFIQRSALTVHARTHTGERPHRCIVCDRTFSDSSSLARHKRIHSGARPYRCGVTNCPKAFCRKTTLLKHIQKHHSKDHPLHESVPIVVDFSNTGPARKVRPRKARGEPQVGEVGTSGFADDSGAEVGSVQAATPMENNPGAADGWGVEEGAAEHGMYQLPVQPGMVDHLGEHEYNYEHTNPYDSNSWQHIHSPAREADYNTQPASAHGLMAPFSLPQAQSNRDGFPAPPSISRMRPGRITTNFTYPHSNDSPGYATAPPIANAQQQGYHCTPEQPRPPGPHIYHANPHPQPSPAPYYSAHPPQPAYTYDSAHLSQPQSYGMMAGSSGGSTYLPRSEMGSPHQWPSYDKLPSSISRSGASRGYPEPSQLCYPHLAPARMLTYHADHYEPNPRYETSHAPRPAVYGQHLQVEPSRGGSHSLDSPQHSSTNSGEGAGSMTLASGLTGAAADSPGVSFGALPSLKREYGRAELHDGGRGYSSGPGGLQLHGMEQGGWGDWGDEAEAGMGGGGYGEQVVEHRAGSGGEH